MSYEKGDLVLVSDSGTTSTRIIITDLFDSSEGSNFYYTYCIESGFYGIVYNEEITCVVSKNFAPDFQSDEDFLFDNSMFYDYLFEMFNFFPYNYVSGSSP